MKRYLAVLALLIAASVAYGSGMTGGSTFNPATNTGTVGGSAFIGNGADNTHGAVLNNTGPVLDNTLRAHWLSTNGGNVLLRNADNTATVVVAPATRSLLAVSLKAVTAADNLVLSGPGIAATATLVKGFFFDNTGLIATAATDNVTALLYYCLGDNVASCTLVDNTVVLGGTAVYSHAPSGTAAVPLGAVFKVLFPTINSTKSFSYRVEGYLR